MSEATVSRLVRHLEGLSMLMRYFVYVLPETVYMHVSTQPKYQFKKKKNVTQTILKVGQQGCQMFSHAVIMD